MTARHLRLDAHSFRRYPWTEEERQQVQSWMTDNGIDPHLTYAITLGEGHVIAEQVDKSDGTHFTATYPVRTLPPVWLSPSVAATHTRTPFSGEHDQKSTRWVSETGQRK